MMRFRNRDEAAAQLAVRLEPWRGRRPLVLGLPRGGVPMARLIAEALGGELDVVLVRKLRAPGQPELAIGAIDEWGTVFHGAGMDAVSPEYLRGEVRAQQEILRARRTAYTAARPPVDVAGRAVILVDDGVATGATMLAAVRAVRRAGAGSITVATAVGAPDALGRVAAEADDMVCLYAPAAFEAVGAWFDDFAPVDDAAVIRALVDSPAAAAHDAIEGAPGDTWN